MLTAADFKPHRSLANAHIQTVLASSKLRRKVIRARRPGMAASSRRLTLDCGDGVRLYAFHSPHPDGARTRGTVVLIHGWEGCRESVYLFSMASQLWDAGYNVVRLDLRDHGDSYHLNEAPFHSARLSDPLGALADITRRIPGADNPYLIGFSLGGNFALRLARHAPEHGLSLRHVLAVSPSINPLATIQAIDTGPRLYSWYFRRKWHRSLAAKERAFPEQFSLDHYRAARSFEQATNIFADEFTEFEDMAAYLAAYQVDSDVLAGLTTPTTILTAADDSVVPRADFDALALPGAAELLITEHGGHCGFVENWRYQCFSERLALERFRHGLP